jgi:Ca2+/Na+ antiporter
MLNNELIIFFVIIILIGLSYYDLKYSIIFCIILYLVYLYFNKLTYESNYDEYNQYDEEVNNILKNIELFRKYDDQNYKLGLKYHNNILKNIKLLNNIHNKFYFKSILEKTRVFLEKTIEKFNSILFSIEDIEESKRLNKLIIDLNKQFNRLIVNSIITYNNRLKNKVECENGMFCNDDLILNLYLNVNEYIHNDNPKLDHNMFDRGTYTGNVKGNEVNYHYGVGVEKNIRSSVMNKIDSDMIPRTGFTDLKDLDPIKDSNKNPYNSEMYNASWSHINFDRLKSTTENKINKVGDDAVRYIRNFSNKSERTGLYNDATNQINRGVSDIMGYFR